MIDKEKIIAYIDKLLEKYPKNYYLLTVAEFIDSLQEEPVSDDLEEAAHKYADIRMSNYETAFYAFMSGANWQKERMMAKEELEYVKYQLELRLPETLDYNGVQVDREDFINDFIKAMKDE